MDSEAEVTSARDDARGPRATDDQAAPDRAVGSSSGELVLLGPVQPDDLPALFRWINDRELVVLNGPYRPVSPAQHERWFEAIQLRDDVVLFAIRLISTGELIGTCQLRGIHLVHRQAELQIRIADPAHWGQGFGSSAIRLMLRVAFEDLNLNRVSLQVFSDNARAVRAYEKVGFAREGVLRQAAFIAGKYVDTIVMAILRDEYLAGR